MTCVPRGWHSHCSRLPSISPLAFYLGGPSVPPAAPAGAHCYQPRRSRCLAAPASQQSVCRSPPCEPASPVVLLCAAPTWCAHYSYRSSVHFAKTTSISPKPPAALNFTRACLSRILSSHFELIGARVPRDLCWPAICNCVLLEDLYCWFEEFGWRVAQRVAQRIEHALPGDGRQASTQARA